VFFSEHHVGNSMYHQVQLRQPNETHKEKDQ